MKLLFKKIRVNLFPLKVLRQETQHIQAKLPCQNPILRKIARGVQK